MAVRVKKKAKDERPKPKVKTVGDRFGASATARFGEKQTERFQVPEDRD